MDYGIEGTVALVTASSSGLGKGSAMALAREGVHVVVNGRDREKLAYAVADIESVANGDVIGRPGDITDPDDLTALVDDTVEEFGRLDHLVTSAGGPPRHSFFELTDEHWYDTFDMLVMSLVRLVREAAPYLRRDSGGSIVNITSLVVKEASPSNPLSSSIRMATMGLEKCLSYQLAPEVRVNAVLPGLFDTPRRNDPGSARVEPSDVPAGRLGEAIELGEVVAFLCSEAAGYLTGAAIPVDGGALESTL